MFLSRFFPVPHFLSMKTVGLDISGHSVHCMELIKTEQGYFPHRYGTVYLPEGAIVGGEIVDKAKCVFTLKEIQKKYNLSFVTISLPEEKAYLYRITVPTDGEYEDEVASSIEENVPLPGKDVLFDWVIVHQDTSRAVISVSVFARTVVESYIDIVRSAGMTPLSCDVETRAIAKAIIQKTDTSAHIVVAIGETKTVFSIVSQGAVQFTSTFFMGAGMLTSIVEAYTKRDKNDARHFKSTTSIIMGTDYPEIRKEFLEIIDRLIQEIKKISLYWYTQKNGEELNASSVLHTNKIESILLCGSDAFIPGLTDYIKNSIDIPVVVAHPWVNCFSTDTHIPDLDPKESMVYATAIGLTIT